MTDKNLSDLITSSYTGGNLIDDTANTTGNIWTAVKISNEIDESANTSFSNAVSEAVDLANAAFTNAVAEAISLSDDAFTNAVSEATSLANAAFSNAVSYADGLLAANDAMVFKGTLGSAGTFTSLPTTHDVGWTIKVTEAGTYAGQVAEVGDMYVSLVSREGAGNQDTDWAVIQANIDGAVTGPVSAANNSVAIFSGTTGKVIADGGKALPSGTIVGTTDTQTLENKTLTSPVINTPTGLVKGDVGLGNVSNDAQLKIDSNLSDLANVATARTNLGLGSIATQNANSVAITGGSINGTTVGATTSSTGNFTNLAYTGTLTGGTGVVNLGSGQLVKDAAGRVGIGTSSPAFKVESVVNSSFNTVGADANIALGVRNTNTSGTRVAMAFSNGIGTGAGIHAVSSSPSTNSHMALSFITRNPSNILDERMRITSAGNVGIGTTSPGQKLSVEGSAAGVENVARFNNQSNDTTRLWLRNSNQSSYWGISGVTADVIASGISAGAMTLGISGNSPIQFWNGTSGSLSVKLTISSNGNVGIGTTSPARSLHVVGANPVLINTTSSNQIVMAVGGTNTGQIFSNSTVAFGVSNGAGAERMRITSAGNVGIGTTAPSANLDVAGRTRIGGLFYASASRSWTPDTTTPTSLFAVSVQNYTFAELTYMLTDNSFPDGTRMGKIYVATRASGNDVTAISISSNELIANVAGSLTTITWSANIIGTAPNRRSFELVATPNQNSGPATIRLFGFSNSANFSINAI